MNHVFADERRGRYPSYDSLTKPLIYNDSIFSGAAAQSCRMRKFKSIASLGREHPRFRGIAERAMIELMSGTPDALINFAERMARAMRPRIVRPARARG